MYYPGVCTNQECVLSRSVYYPGVCTNQEKNYPGVCTIQECNILYNCRIAGAINQLEQKKTENTNKTNLQSKHSVMLDKSHHHPSHPHHHPPHPHHHPPHTTPSQAPVDRCLDTFRQQWSRSSSDWSSAATEQNSTSVYTPMHT